MGDDLPLSSLVRQTAAFAAAKEPGEASPCWPEADPATAVSEQQWAICWRVCVAHALAMGQNAVLGGRLSLAVSRSLTPFG